MPFAGRAARSLTSSCLPVGEQQPGRPRVPVCAGVRAHARRPSHTASPAPRKGRGKDTVLQAGQPSPGMGGSRSHMAPDGGGHRPAVRTPGSEHAGSRAPGPTRRWGTGWGAPFLRPVTRRRPASCHICHLRTEPGPRAVETRTLCRVTKVLPSPRHPRPAEAVPGVDDRTSWGPGAGAIAISGCNKDKRGQRGQGRTMAWGSCP